MEDSTSSSRTITLAIRPSKGPTFNTSISTDSTVLQLKEQLATAEFPASSVRLVYSGRVLKDEDQLSSYAIQEGHTIHMVKTATNRASEQAVQSAGHSSTPMTSRRPGVGFGGQGGEMNPELMNMLMSNPMVQDMMSNPEIVRRMMMSNPQTRQVMENNPEVAQMINDPAFLRQSLDMARNPNLMQQAMRNNDRAISNLEMIPGGFNHLKRMYHSVQEPMEASRNQPLPSTDELNQRFAADLNADTQPITGSLNTTPLPNPWAPRPHQQHQSAAMNPFAAMMQGTSGVGGRHGGMMRSPFGPAASGASPFPGLFGAPPPLSQNTSAGATGPDSNQASPNPFAAMLGAGARSGAMGANAQTPQGRPINPFGFPELGSPEAFQQMMQFNQFMRQMQQQHPGQPNFSGMSGINPFGLPAFPPADPTTSIRQHSTTNASTAASQTTTPAAAPTEPAQPPEERFQTQLAALRDMGFSDDSRNVRALLASGGNVDSAVEWLLRM